MTPPIRAWLESHDYCCPATGTALRQVTSAPAITHNVYCEQPYCSSDGNHFVMFRTLQPDMRMPGELMMYDINSYHVFCLEPKVLGVGAGPWGIANAAYSGIIYVLVPCDEGRVLVRWDIHTLEREELFLWDGCLDYGLLTVSADCSQALSYRRLASGNFGIFRVDLKNGHKSLIHENPHIFNPHLQFRLHSAERILVQENRGSLVSASGGVLRSCDERGIGLYSIAADGSDRQDFPVGPPHTASTTGHACWVGDTDQVVISLSEPYNDGKRTGNVVIAGVGDAAPRVVFDSPHVWTHISVSRCGRYVISDCGQLPGMPLLISSLATGKARILCHSMTTGGGAQYSHAHPYMTSDNRWVVYNSDRTGLAQIYLAQVPDGLLDELDDERRH